MKCLKCELCEVCIIFATYHTGDAMIPIIWRSARQNDITTRTIETFEGIFFSNHDSRINSILRLYQYALNASIYDKNLTLIILIKIKSWLKKIYNYNTILVIITPLCHACL